MNLIMQAEIFSVAGYGKLRITYNWLYSALNCDPNDASPFVWNFYQVDSQRIALSPQNSFNGMQLYASVRDDWDWYVQAQAPNSADWIRAAQRDEFIGWQLLDMSMAKFTGFNGQFIGANNYEDFGDIRTNGVNTGTHQGYRIRSSIYPTATEQCFWFLKVVNSGSSGISRIAINNSDLASGIQSVLQGQGVSVSVDSLSGLVNQINTQ